MSFLAQILCCCFFIAWPVATARLYFRQVRRLAIAITKNMDCDELIEGLLSCSGEQLRYDEGTAGDSLISPTACSGVTTGQQRLLRNDEVTGQKAVQDRVQNYRERLASDAAGGGGRLSRAVWATRSRKSINRQPYRGA